MNLLYYINLLVACAIGSHCVEVALNPREVCEFKEKCNLVDVDYSVMEADEASILGVKMQRVGEKETTTMGDKMKTVFFGCPASFDNAEFTAKEEEDGSYTSMHATGQTTQHGDFEIYHKADIGYVMGINETFTGENNGDEEMKKAVKEMKKFVAAQGNGAEDRSMTNADYYALKTKGETDKTTKVVVKITIYYTKAVRGLFSTKADFETYITNLMADASKGFADSFTLVTLKLHCLKQIDVAEKQSQAYMLEYLSSMKNNTFNAGFPKNLCGANIAVLLTTGLRNTGCGQAWVGVPALPYCVVDANCASEERSFHHEVAHLFGADHNREDTTYTEGDGFGLQNQYFGKQWRSIMSYSSGTLYRQRYNYFSTPKVVFKDNGKDAPNGVVGKIDNGHFIRTRRFIMNGINKNGGQKCLYRRLL